jgi:Type VI secretion system/phage-baseplate injector OB domain
MNRLQNAMISQSFLAERRIGQPRFGVVASVDPIRSMVRVRFQPENVLSGWLPLLCSWIGSGWGVACSPNPGDQVVIIPQEGDLGAGIVIGSVYSANQRPPVAPVGEYWLVHQSGASLKLVNDGTIRVDGNLYVNGDIYDRQGSLNNLRQIYNIHTHPGFQQSTTGTPNQVNE